MKNKLTISLIIISYILATTILYQCTRDNPTAPVFINLASKTNYFIHCDLDNCMMYVFKNNKLHKKYPISGGADVSRSPYGSWVITSKDTWGEGFGGRWMGFNVPWGTLFLVHRIMAF